MSRNFPWSENSKLVRRGVGLVRRSVISDRFSWIALGSGPNYNQRSPPRRNKKFPSTNHMRAFRVAFSKSGDWV
jgi:hypothetical protein